jgi:ethanolamine utilization cobalamin adenosyltransferase
MKKTLIGSSRVDEFIKEGEKTLYMDKTMILTSGAKDILRKRGVAIEYGPRPVAETETEKTAPVSCPGETQAPESPQEKQEESIDSLMETFLSLLESDPEVIPEISRIVLNKLEED